MLVTHTNNKDAVGRWIGAHPDESVRMRTEYYSGPGTCWWDKASGDMLFQDTPRSYVPYFSPEDDLMNNLSILQRLWAGYNIRIPPAADRQTPANEW